MNVILLNAIFVLIPVLSFHQKRSMSQLTCKRFPLQVINFVKLEKDSLLSKLVVVTVSLYIRVVKAR